MRLSRLTALPPDLPVLDTAARAEGFGMIGVLLAEGFAPFTPPGCALFAARDATGGLLGIGGMTRDPVVSALRMRRFYVRPEARRCGVGRALVAALLDQARAAGADRVRLRAPDAAAPFWESCGFAPVAEAQATHALVVPRRPQPAAPGRLDDAP